MSENNYELHWTGKNGVGDMPGGQYASKVDAIGAIQSVCDEFNAQRGPDDGIEFNVEDFSVRYTGPELIVSNIRVEHESDNLFAHFTVRKINNSGNETIINTGEWIDYEDGLLEAVDVNASSDFGHFGFDDLCEIHEIVNDHFRANPIDEDLLETYQQAAEARRETARDQANSLSM